MLCMMIKLKKTRLRWAGATTKQMPRNNLIVKITKTSYLGFEIKRELNLNFLVFLKY